MSLNYGLDSDKKAKQNGANFVLALGSEQKGDGDRDNVCEMSFRKVQKKILHKQQ